MFQTVGIVDVFFGEILKSELVLNVMLSDLIPKVFHDIGIVAVCFYTSCVPQQPYWLA